VGGIATRELITIKTITPKTLIRKVQKEINIIQKLEPISFNEKIDRARAVGYLVSVCSQVIEKHENEKRLDELEDTLKELAETQERRLTA
jgi:peptidoglycan hydrolase CwlO-like protein